MNRVELERDYWNEAALDPEVDIKYISDVSTEEMIKALEIPDLFEGVAYEILEIGCGVGRLTKELYGKYSTCGVDISGNMLEIARFRDKNTCFELIDGKTLPYKQDTFWYIYCVLVFQHLKADAISNYLIEVRRVLKPQGIFRFQFIEGTEQEPFSNHYRLDEMTLWCEIAGLEVIKVDKELCHHQWTWITARKP